MLTVRALLLGNRHDQFVRQGHLPSADYHFTEELGFLSAEDKDWISAYTAWQDRMMQRPTVRKTVESEQNISTS